MLKYLINMETSITLIYMNNHWVGQAPPDACQLAELLAKEGANLSPKSPPA